MEMIEFHIANFMKAANSPDLVYNFDTSELKSDPRLRRMLDQGRNPALILKKGGRPLPVFGNTNRAVNIWYPRIVKYHNRKRNEHPWLQMTDLNRDVMGNIARNLSGKDLIGLCLMNNTLNKFCDDNQVAVFYEKINREYPRFVASDIPNDQLREAYFKLAHGGKMKKFLIDLNPTDGNWTTDEEYIEGFSSIRDVKMQIYINAINVVYFLQTGGNVYSYVERGADVAAEPYGSMMRNPEQFSYILGRPIDQDIFIPVKVSIDEPVKEIITTESLNTTFLLTENGNLYMHGIFTDVEGREMKIPKPAVIQFVSDEPIGIITNVYIVEETNLDYKDYIYIVDSNNNLYRSLFRDIDYSDLNPGLISLRSEKVIQMNNSIVAMNNHDRGIMLLLDNGNLIYTTNFPYMNERDIILDNVKNVDIGRFVANILTFDGVLVKHQRLKPLTNITNVLFPNAIGDVKITNINYFGSHVYALMSSGDLYMSNNESGPILLSRNVMSFSAGEISHNSKTPITVITSQ